MGRKKTVIARMLEAEEKRITDSEFAGTTMSLADQLKNTSNLLTQNTKTKLGSMKCAVSVS